MGIGIRGLLTGLGIVMDGDKDRDGWWLVFSKNQLFFFWLVLEWSNNHSKLFLRIWILHMYQPHHVSTWLVWKQIEMAISHTADGRNPAITTWDVQNLVNNGINYQPQLVSRISSINSMTSSAGRNCLRGVFAPKKLQWNTTRNLTKTPRIALFWKDILHFPSHHFWYPC